MTLIPTRAGGSPRKATFASPRTVSPRTRSVVTRPVVPTPPNPTSKGSPRRSSKVGSSPQAVSFVQQGTAVQPNGSVEGAAASVHARRPGQAVATLSPRKGANPPFQTDSSTISPRKGVRPLRSFSHDHDAREKAESFHITPHSKMVQAKQQVAAKAASRAVVETLSPRRRLRLGPATVPR